MMQTDKHSAFEAFLVEDVILTLGNLRNSMAWIEDEGLTATERQIAIDRLYRQIDLLEGRAREIGRGLRKPVEGDENLFAFLAEDATRHETHSLPEQAHSLGVATVLRDAEMAAGT